MAVLAAVVAAAVFASTAGSSTKLHTPGELLIWSPHGATHETDVIVAPAGPCCELGGTPPTLSYALYIPAGYHLDLGLRPGTPVGGVLAAASRGALVTRDPAGDTSDPCAPGLHAALWGADLADAGKSLPIRVFVDPTSGAEMDMGAYRLTYCTSYSVELILTDLMTPSRTGLYMWRAFITPPANNVWPIPKQTYELRAIVPIPHVITVKTRYLPRWQTLQVSGKVIAGPGPEVGSWVQVIQGRGAHARGFADARTGADGTFRVKKIVHQGRARRTLALEIGAGTSGPCTSPSPAPAGCGNERSSEADILFTATIPKR